MWLVTTSLIGPRNVKILPERGKLSNEVIAAPQTTWVAVVSYEDTTDGFSPYGRNLSIGLGHEVNEGTTRETFPLKWPSLRRLLYAESPSAIAIFAEMQ